MTPGEQAAIARIEARMRPGVISRSGFLGEGERLADVLGRDAETLAQLGLTASKIADALTAVLEPVLLGRRSIGRVGPYQIWLRRHKGSQRCPFLDDSRAIRCEAAGGARLASVDWRIRNITTGEELSGPGLIVHLIGGHSFFEGFGSPYRVSPESLARLLELTPAAGPNR